jgi:hypothetical protein
VEAPQVTARDTIREQLAALAPTASARALQVAERELLKSLATILVADGYTLAMASEALGLPRTTLNTWRGRDEGFKSALEGGADISRKWLWGALKDAVDGDTKAAGKALNIAANLLCPELRSTKVEATVNNVPEPGAARATVLKIANKGRAVDDDE